MINYDVIEKLLVETLDKETPESLREWLDSKRNEERLANLGEGEYQPLDIERNSFSYERNITNVDKPTNTAGQYNYSLAA